MMRHALCLFALVLAASGVGSRVSQATTVLAMSTDELVAKAEATVVAEVTAVDTHWPPGHHYPFTEVTLAVRTVVTGHAAENVAIRYLGGIYGDRAVKVEGMRVPRIGERGIYMIEAGVRPTIHPLVGWSQGHFLLRSDSEGNDRVFTHDGRAVIGLHELTDGRDPTPFSNGIATDIQTLPTWSADSAISVEQFVRLLRDKTRGSLP